MKKIALIAVAGFLSLASTAALADSFYFGFTQSAPRTVYVAPQPVYVAPRPVYYQAPRPVYYSPKPMLVSYESPRYRKNCEWHDRGHHRGQSNYYRGGRGHH